MNERAPVAVAAVGVFLMMSQGAWASAMSVSACPGDTRNTPKAYVINELRLDDFTVNRVPEGDDESQPMSMSWSASGQIWLSLDGGARVLIGTARRPARGTPCNDFAVEINPALKLQASHHHGLPHFSTNTNHEGLLSRPVTDELDLTTDGGLSVTLEGYWKEIKVDGRWVRL